MKIIRMRVEMKTGATKKNLNLSGKIIVKTDQSKQKLLKIKEFTRRFHWIKNVR